MNTAYFSIDIKNRSSEARRYARANPRLGRSKLTSRDPKGNANRAIFREMKAPKKPLSASEIQGAQCLFFNDLPRTQMLSDRKAPN